MRMYVRESVEVDACELSTATTRGRFVRDGRCVGRYVVFGVMDGVILYVWYEWVDCVVLDDVMRLDVMTTAMKVAMDAVIYNLIWGVFFIVFMGVLSVKDVEMIVGDVKRDWKVLIMSNLMFWVLMNFIIYGFTSLNFRV